MYLSKRTYVKNWDHMKPEQKHKISIDGPSAKAIKPKRISYITEEVMYWRKSNQIHQWFVDNVQNGEDDCKEYYVSRDQLQTLLDVVKKVLLFKPSKEKAAELLPTQGGCFVGSEDYDEYYWQDLEETKKGLTELLAEPDIGDFHYQSSW